MDQPAESLSGNPIRVLLANLNESVSELVTELLAHEPTIQIIGQVQDPVDLLVRAGEGVDVLVLGAPGIKPLPGICSHLFAEYPDLRIVVIATTGEAAMLYWLGLRRRRLRSVSAPAFTAFIRHAYGINPAV